MLSKKLRSVLLLSFISSVCLSFVGFHAVAQAQTLADAAGNAPFGAKHDPTRIHITPAVQGASTVAAINIPTIQHENPSEPTPTPTEKPLPTIFPTTAPTTVSPSTTPIPQAAQTAPATNPGGLNADLLFSMSNTFRQQLGLPLFQKDERVCSLARERATEIEAEIYGGYMHAGLQARNLPYWNTENIISMRTEEAAFTWWVNDPPHRAALVGNYTYSCVACVGNACAQEFTNFQPK